MTGDAGSSSATVPEKFEDEELLMLYGGESGWVEPKTWCDHLPSLTSDLSHIPTPDTFCFRCHHPAENWVCLFCKDVLCSRFINKHMLQHYEQEGHCIALSYRHPSFAFPWEASMLQEDNLQAKAVFSKNFWQVGD
ncbi:Histone deacetylase 6 [Bienertia sinuspersici]